MTLKRAVLLPLLFVSAALAQSAPAAAPDPNAPTLEQAQAITERLLRTFNGPNTQIVYGQIPEGLNLSLDKDFTVQATFKTKHGNEVIWRVLATTPGDLLTTRDRLTPALQASGWTALNQNQVGFVGENSPLYGNFYRTGDANLVMNVGVQVADGHTDIDLNINPVPASQIAFFKKNNAPQSSLPLLLPLPGATTRTAAYGGGGPNGTLSSVDVKTSASQNEVFSHYSAQLKAKGWKALTDTTTGPLRAVTYALTDLNGREALGTLGIRTWKSGEYVLTVSVQGFKP